MWKIFTPRCVVVLCVIAWSCRVSYGEDNPAPCFKAVAFDYFVIFDGTGRATGTYFYELSTERGKQIRSMQLIK